MYKSRLLDHSPDSSKTVAEQKFPLLVAMVRVALGYAAPRRVSCKDMGDDESDSGRDQGCIIAHARTQHRYRSLAGPFELLDLA
jgi:hypothetical protein